METVVPKAESKPKRRWLQFSLRTFLVLLTVFGIWVGLHVRSVHKQKESVAAIKRLGGWYYYDFQKFDPDTHKVDLKATSWVPAWLLSHLGEDFFHNVEMVNMVYNDDSGIKLRNKLATDEVVRYLEGVPRLTGLFLHTGQATDAGMKHVGKLTHLRVLFMWDASELSDAGIAHLGRLSRLKYLQINSLWVGPATEITDAGLAHLAGLTNLEHLEMANCPVTNEGLLHLKGLSNLKFLYLHDTKVDDISVLKESLPNCTITASQSRRPRSKLANPAPSYLK